MLSFNDGNKVDSSGELRIVRLSDGMYVAGEGMMIPVCSRGEAEDLIKNLRKDIDKNRGK